MRGEWSVSIRRACRVLLVDTSTYHYKSRRTGQAGLEQRVKEICQTRVRYGYRSNATRPNETRAMDFVHDQLATGQKLRVLTIIDTLSRFSPALEPRLSFRGTDVVEVLEKA